MKVCNMLSSKGNRVPNQFLIKDTTMTIPDNDRTLTLIEGDAFQSYNSIIALRSNSGDIYLDYLWNYSKTTSKYRNQFLNETTAETRAKLLSGEYTLTDLNQ
jgi:hypothetical protein